METKQPSRGWINALFIRRKESRGDLVGTLAMWSFAGMVVCLVFGGSSFDVGGLHLVIPALGVESLTGLLAVILGHITKSTIEGVKNGKAPADPPADPPAAP